ncbi:MAG: dihydropteroate synthase [Spirochaetota bacterium]
MGIINVTPDSFYQGSRLQLASRAVDRALYFQEAGADIIDVGGESTRPGAQPVSTDQELRRVIPVIDGIRKKTYVTISIDTCKPEVASRAIDSGAQIVNDVSGLKRGNSLGHVAADRGCYMVLMHMRGTPADMQEHAVYQNVCAEVSAELDESINKALEAGIPKRRIIIDPGIGFAKLAEHNLTLIKNIGLFIKKGYPVMIGLSRKSFLAPYSGASPDNRLVSTIAANAVSIFLGADIIRVHDVKEAVETARVVEAIKNASS